MMEKNRFYVYVWLDPRKPGVYTYGDHTFDYEPIYVGKGHGDRITLFKRNWNPFLTNKLGKINFCPVYLMVMNNLTEEEAFTKEKEVIAKIGRFNLKKGPLCNLTDGGEGPSGLIVSDVVKQKIRIAGTGRVASEETRQKQSEAQKRRGPRGPMSEAQKLKQSLATRGKPKSEEHRQSIKQAKQFTSEYTKQKMSDSAKGKKKGLMSEEQKQKLSKASIGKPKSKEHAENSKIGLQLRNIRSFIERNKEFLVNYM